MISFRVDGIPKGQPRPRAFVRGKHAGVYDPGTADGWRAAVAMAAAPLRPAVPWDGPIGMIVELDMPRPKRLHRKCDPPGRIRCTSKPDVDNSFKSCCDELTRVGFWRDDAQIAECTVRKYYHAIGAIPGAQITVMRLEEVNT